MSKKIKAYISKHGHKVFDCPFCDYWGHVRSEPNPCRDLERHMRNAAKNEALQVALAAGTDEEGKLSKESIQHLDYYRDHTSFKKTIVTETRQFDDNFELV